MYNYRKRNDLEAVLTSPVWDRKRCTASIIWHFKARLVREGLNGLILDVQCAKEKKEKLWKQSLKTDISDLVVDLHEGIGGLLVLPSRISSVNLILYLATDRKSHIVVKVWIGENYESCYTFIFKWLWMLI